MFYPYFHHAQPKNKSAFYDLNSSILWQSLNRGMATT